MEKNLIEMIKLIDRSYNILTIILLAIISSLFIWQSSATSQMQGPSIDNLTGEELFIQNRCVRCHTIGRGRFVGPDLKGVGTRYSKDEIVKWIENPQLVYQEKGKMPFNEGYPPMPPMKVPTLQAEKIADYVLSEKTPENGAQAGVISGQVINKTIDSPASGIELTLTSYMGDKPTDDKKLRSDEQGNFIFENLPWDSSYGITVDFEGAQYSTDKMVFLPNEDNKILTLPIFEPTLEEENITVLESQLIVQSEGDMLSVADLSLFNNSGDKIFVGGNELEDGRKESLRLSTPKEAQSVNFIHGINPDDIVQTPYGFADTTSIMPGQKRVVYAYELPTESGTTNFEKILEYPTDSFLLLISDSQRTVEVEGLTGGESKQIRGQNYLQWTGTDLKTGHKIKVELTGPSISPDYLKWGALGVVLLVVIAGIIYSLISKKEPSDDQSTEKIVDTESSRMALIKEIAFLDDSFEAGQIEEDKYKMLRKEKFEELKKYTRRP